MDWLLRDLELQHDFMYVLASTTAMRVQGFRTMPEHLVFPLLLKDLNIHIMHGCV